MAANALTSHRPTVLVYREYLLPLSETFILAQMRALRRFQPLLVGRTRVDGLPIADVECELLNNGGLRGKVNEFVHRAGRVPPPVARRLDQREPVILHAHFGPDALNAVPLARRLRIPMIVTFHGYDATQRVDLTAGLSRWRYGRRRVRLIREAALVLTVSEYIRDRLLGLGFPPEQVKTHYTGIDLDRFTPAPRVRREPVVLGVGRLVEKKGFTHLIAAMVAVRNVCSRARLVLIGDGPLASQLRNQALASGLGNVMMTGPLPAPEIAGWMRRARVLAVPSVTASSGDTEGLPTALLEGMASGLPAVGTRHAGIPEAITHESTGLLVDEGDPDSLASSLIQLLTNDDLWDRASSSSRRVVQERFDLRKQSEALENLYAQVATRPA